MSRTESFIAKMHINQTNSIIIPTFLFLFKYFPDLNQITVDFYNLVKRVTAN